MHAVLSGCFSERYAREVFGISKIWFVNPTFAIETAEATGVPDVVKLSD